MLGGLVVIGFCLPLLIKNSGSLLELISTYVVPAVVGGLAVAYDGTCMGPRWHSRIPCLGLPSPTSFEHCLKKP